MSTLNDTEILEFWNELSAKPKDSKPSENDTLTLKQLHEKLEQVYEEIDPLLPTLDQRKHRSNFLKGLFAHRGKSTTYAEFCQLVKWWQVPSQKPAKKDQYEKNLSYTRKLTAVWSVHGYTILFLSIVFSLILGLGIEQCLKYALDKRYRFYFGLGLASAKLGAGCLYFTLFFMLLAPLKHFQTILQRSSILSRLINTEFTRTIHIMLAFLAYFWTLWHAVSHSAGTLVWGSRQKYSKQIIELTGNHMKRTHYVDFVLSRPGWTGIVALLCFTIIILCALPPIRKNHFEIFQLTHLLMFPMIAMLILHGTLALIQKPMLPYFLAFPTLLIVLERSIRLYRGFRGVPATLELNDEETVVITFEDPKGRAWNYSAGQHVLVQVPYLSRWQWHPFTVSSCRGPELQVTIKDSGDWTKALHQLLSRTEKGFLRMHCGLDGPFSAPAQRFNKYDRAIIIGSGIGVTPFSAIISDLELNYHLDRDANPFANLQRYSVSFSFKRTKSSQSMSTLAQSLRSPDYSTRSPYTSVKSPSIGSYASSDSASVGKRSLFLKHPKKRIDFHWSVREKDNLLWFRELLNRAEVLNDKSFLSLNIHTHITSARKTLSAHVFRFLLDRYRTQDTPYSALTGLINKSHFGRPDLAGILNDFDQDMRKERFVGQVGIFFCGTPMIARELADRCAVLNAKAKTDGLKLQFVFQSEVF